jgi:hypothetical protein
LLGFSLVLGKSHIVGVSNGSGVADIESAVAAGNLANGVAAGKLNELLRRTTSVGGNS